jgi:hypothetical protein
MKLVDVENLRAGDDHRHWLRPVIVILLAAGFAAGHVLFFPEPNIVSAHADTRYLAIVPAIAGAYFAVAALARWVSGRRWSPEFVTLAAVATGVFLFGTGSMTYQYVGHVHRIGGLWGVPILLAVTVAATFVSPPARFRRLPGKYLVVGTTVLLLVAAIAEYQLTSPPSAESMGEGITF